MNDIPEPFQQLVNGLVTAIPNMAAALVIFLSSLYFAGLISNFVHKLLAHKKVDHELTLLITKISRWAIVILGAVAGLQQVGFDVTTFLAGLGILGFTVGFALQDVSKNFIAGMLLLLQQPFEIGDVIEANDYIGTVQDVDLRATELRTFDGKYVLIPNADVFTNPITNYSREPVRRLDLNIGVAYDTDLADAKAVVLTCLAESHYVVSKPVPQVVYTGFGDSSIDFTVYFWVDTRKHGLLEAKDAIILAVNQAFREKGIDMPYPTQTILLKQGETS